MPAHFAGTGTPCIRPRMSDVTRHSGLPFMKMHGLGNDFVVIDARVTPREVTADLARGSPTGTGASASTSWP
jgi:hypothetical protein